MCDSVEVFEAKAKKYGGSLIITIPRYFQDKLEIKDGTDLKVILEKR